MDVQAPPDGSDRLFVLERAGRIRVFEADSTTSENGLIRTVASRFTVSAADSDAAVPGSESPS